MTKSLNRRSNISVIIAQRLDILDLIAISSLPLNKAIVRSHPELVSILSSSSWRSSQSLHVPFELERFQILPPHRQIKGLQNGKVLLRCGRKKALSDLVTFSLSPFLFFVVMHYLCVLLFCFKLV